MKKQSLVAPAEVETRPLTGFDTALNISLQPRKRLVLAEHKKIVTITQRNRELSGDFLYRHQKALRFFEFEIRRTVAAAEKYLIKLPLVAGLRNSHEKMKFLECLQSKPEATVDDILLIIQWRKRIVQIVSKQSEVIEIVSSF